MVTEVVNPVGKAKYTNLGGPGGGTHAYGTNWQSSQAMDIGVPVGTPVYSATDGVVVRVKSETFGGKSEGIEIGVDGMGTSRSAFYGHLSRVAKGIKVGRQLGKGDYLGESGAACGTMGPGPSADWAAQVVPYPPPCGPAHLHFALSAEGQRYDNSTETRDVDVVGLVTGAPFAFIPRPNTGGLPPLLQGPAPNTGQVPVDIGDAWGTLRQAISSAMPNAAQTLYDLKPRIIRASQ